MVKVKLFSHGSKWPPKRIVDILFLHIIRLLLPHVVFSKKQPYNFFSDKDI